MTKVFWVKAVDKQIGRAPKHIVTKFLFWVSSLKEIGIIETRKFKGFHDEPLHGYRRGQRSIRLSKAYRAIYIQKENGDLELIEVLEVNKHDY